MISVDDLFNNKTPTFKYIPHQFKQHSSGKPVCSQCGLVALRNKFTEWSIKHGCLSDYHPSYDQARRLK